MRKAISAVVGAVLVLAPTSCGTICNFAGGLFDSTREPQVYGGVRFDLQAASDILDSMDHPAHYTGPVFDIGGNQAMAMILLPVMLVDPVLSAVTDTLTLPITIYLQEKRAAVYKADNTAREPVNPPSR